MPITVILTVTRGKCKTKQIRFTSPEKITIGRHHDCSIVLREETVSRKHCELQILLPTIKGTDLGSLNGVYVNDEAVTNFELQSGDVLNIGINCTMVVKVMFERKMERDSSAFLASCFEIVSPLAKSPIKETWRIIPYEHNETDKNEEYVLKLYPPNSFQTEERLDYVKEIAESLVELKHENIVQTYCCGMSNNNFYMISEMCEGGNLQQLIHLSGGRLSIELATTIILQVIDGLIYAHNNNVIHRNLQPSNICLSGSLSKPIAKITGFALGLANKSNQEFMSNKRIADYWYPNPDTWAVVASYYFMLTGSYPRDTDYSELAVPIKKRDSRIPNQLAQVIDEALDEDSELELSELKELILQVI